MVMYIVLICLLSSIIYTYLYKKEGTRIIITPRGNMYSIITYSNGIVTNMKLVSSRILKKWFEDFKNDKKLDEEGLEFDLESGKPIKKKRTRTKKNKDI